MVMRAQPEGMQRVKRATDDGGKASEYDIFLGPPVLQHRTNVGYSKRVVHGSVSSWEGYSVTETGLPSSHKDHGELMTTLADKYVTAHPDKIGDVPAEGTSAPVPAQRAPRQSRGKTTVTSSTTLDTPEGAPKPASRTRKSRATRAAEKATAGASEASADASEDREPGTANPEAVAAVEAAYASDAGVHVVVATDEVTAAETTTEAPETAEGDEAVIVVAEDAEGDVVVAETTLEKVEAALAGAGALQPDGTIGEQEPEHTWQQPEEVPGGTDPFATTATDPFAGGQDLDPFADPLAAQFRP